MLVGGDASAGCRLRMSSVMSALSARVPIARSQSAQPAALARILGIFVALALVVPLWLWAEIPDPKDPDLAAYLALGVVEYCALRLSVMAHSAQPRLLAITFFVFIYVWGGLAAFAQITAGVFPWLIRHGPNHPYLGMLQIILALSAYEIGQLIALRRPRIYVQPIRLALSQRSVLWVCVAATVLFLIGMLMLGGPQVLFKTRAAYGIAVGAAVSSKMQSLVGSSLMRAPTFAAFVLVCIICKRDWRTMRTGRKRAFLWLLLYSATLNLIGNWPPALPRQWLGVVVLTPVFVLVSWRRWQVASLAVTFVAVILFVFPYADAFRREISLSSSALESALKTPVVEQILHKGDFDVFQQSLNNMVAAEARGHTLGMNFLGAALFWFPRSIWPSKPDGTGVEVAKAVGYRWNQTNLSAPLWMEFYAAFGWWGIAVLMGLFSYVSGALDRAFIRSRSEPYMSSLFHVLVPFFAAYQFILVRGDLLNGTAQAAPAIVLFLVALKLRRKSLPA